MMNFLSNRDYRKEIIILFLVLLFTNSLFLVNTGLYWDDWVSLDYLGTPASAGRMKILSFLDYYKFRPSIIRWLLFFSDFFSGLFLYLIFKNDNKISSFAIYLTLIILTIPIYFARYTFCCSDYYFSLLYFYAASFFYIKLQDNNTTIYKNILYNCLSIFLFIKSFQTASLFVFYIVPFVYSYYKREGEEGFCFSKTSLHKITNYIKENFIFLILPFVMYIIKKIFFTPDIIYVNYYTISKINILKSPLLYLDSLTNILQDLYKMNIEILYKSIFLILIIYIILRSVYSDNIVKAKKNIMNLSAIKLLFISMLMGFFSTFAYSSLGFVGNIFSWESRHLLLLGIPLSLFILAFGIAISYCRFGINTIKLRMFLAIIIVIFSTDTFYIGYNMYKENIKEDFLILHFKDSDVIKNNQVFEINEINGNNFFKDLTRFYDFSGYAYKAYGTRNHLIVSKEDVSQIGFIISIKDNLDYKIKDVTSSELQGLISFEMYVTPKRVIKSVIYKLINKQKYESLIYDSGKFVVELF